MACSSIRTHVGCNPVGGASVCLPDAALKPSQRCACDVSVPATSGPRQRPTWKVDTDPRLSCTMPLMEPNRAMMM